jgi:hypothetical protein
LDGEKAIKEFSIFERDKIPRCPKVKGEERERAAAIYYERQQTALAAAMCAEWRQEISL